MRTWRFGAELGLGRGERQCAEQNCTGEGRTRARHTVGQLTLELAVRNMQRMRRYWDGSGCSAYRYTGNHMVAPIHCMRCAVNNCLLHTSTCPMLLSPPVSVYMWYSLPPHAHTHTYTPHMHPPYEQRRDELPAAHLHLLHAALSPRHRILVGVVGPAGGPQGGGTTLAAGGGGGAERAVQCPPEGRHNESGTAMPVCW